MNYTKIKQEIEQQMFEEEDKKNIEQTQKILNELGVELL
jgi:hypothetical protein